MLLEIQSCGPGQFVVVHKLRKLVSVSLQKYASDTRKLLVLQTRCLSKANKDRRSWARTPTCIIMPSMRNSEQNVPEEWHGVQRFVVQVARMLRLLVEASH